MEWHIVSFPSGNSRKGCQRQKQAGIAKMFNSKGFYVIISKKQNKREPARQEPSPSGMQPGRVVGNWDAGAFGVGSVFCKSMSDKDLKKKSKNFSLL
jgi:hypothetical protein